MPSDLPDKRAIVLNVDGWRPDMLGPYGNTWIETTCLNRLAAESTVWEACWTATPDPAAGLESMLAGRHPLDRKSGASADTVLSDLVATYVTDRMVLNADQISQSFDRIVQIDSEVQTDSPAESIDQTATARFFAELIDWISDADESDLYWIDFHGLTDRWDAPLRIRDAFRAEEDPEAPTLVEPPSGEFHLKLDDPDLLLGYQQAYAAQIRVFDRCLDVLVETLRAAGQLDHTALILTGQRGYPLGEHGVVGYYRPSLHKESLHVPLVVRWPGSPWAGFRSQGLIQPHVLWNILAAWYRDQPDQLFDELQQEIVRAGADEKLDMRRSGSSFVVATDCNDPGAMMIATPAWKLIRGAGRKLYVRPDDLWEFNDVHDRCREIVDKLDAALDQAVRLLGEMGHLSDLVLDDDLLDQLD